MTAALLRVLLPFTVVLAVAGIGGVELTQGVAGLLMLLLTAEGVALVATFWGLGLVYKFRTQRSGRPGAGRRLRGHVPVRRARCPWRSWRAGSTPSPGSTR